MGRLPVFESLNRGEMAQGPLGNMAIRQGDIAVQRGFQVGRGVEVMGLQHLLDAAIEAFYHAIRLGPTRRNQAMFDGLLMACSAQSRSNSCVPEGWRVRVRKRSVNSEPLSVRHFWMRKGAA